MIVSIKQDDFEDYWIPIQKDELSYIILTLKNKYPSKIKYIEEINTFLLKFTQS